MLCLGAKKRETKSVPLPGRAGAVAISPMQSSAATLAKSGFNALTSSSHPKRAKPSRAASTSSGVAPSAAATSPKPDLGAGGRDGKSILSLSPTRVTVSTGSQQLAPDAVLAMVRDALAGSIAAARNAGIGLHSVVLDPGYGFGKRFGENFCLLKRQAELLSLGRPLLAGISRKSFLGHTLAPLHGGMSAPVDARENASLAAMVAAILHGASMVRVHNVRPAVEAARIADAILAAG